MGNGVGTIKVDAAYMSRWNKGAQDMPSRQDGAGGSVGVDYSFMIPGANFTIDIGSGLGFSRFFPKSASPKLEYNPYTGGGVSFPIMRRMLKLQVQGGFVASLTERESQGIRARFGGYAMLGTALELGRRLPGVSLNFMFRGFKQSTEMPSSYDFMLSLGVTY